MTTDTTEANIATIRQFIRDWSNLDAEQLADYFTEDGTYHNMPIAPVIRQSCGQGLHRRLHQQLERNNLGSVEYRRQRQRGDCRAAGSNQNPVPVMWTCPVSACSRWSNGKIHVWRDYFDMNTFTAAMSS